MIFCLICNIWDHAKDELFFLFVLFAFKLAGWILLLLIYLFKAEHKGLCFHINSNQWVLSMLIFSPLQTVYYWYRSTVWLILLEHQDNNLYIATCYSLSTIASLFMEAYFCHGIENTKGNSEKKRIFRYKLTIVRYKLRIVEYKFAVLRRKVCIVKYKITIARKKVRIFTFILPFT